MTDLPDQSEWELELGRLVPELLKLSAGYSRSYDAPTLASSVRAADDKATWPLEIGHHVAYCLVQAIDMCEGIAELVTNNDGLQVPLASTYPLARAAIESASMAIWMLAPTSRRDRVVRRLQAAHDEMTYERAFFKSVVEGAPVSKEQAIIRANAKDAQHLKRRMKEIARVNDIQPAEYVETMPSWEAIVREGGTSLPGNRKTIALAAWRFASGLTHPSFVRGRLAHTFLQTQPVSEPSRGEITADISWIVTTASIAQKITVAALTRYYFTKGQVNGERPVPEPSRAG